MPNANQIVSKDASPAEVGEVISKNLSNYIRMLTTLAQNEATAGKPKDQATGNLKKVEVCQKQIDNLIANHANQQPQYRGMR